ncbi:MAG: endonuclease III domain-containing protein [Syntrophobacteraceae bacterium]|nr:endonuclease III domain-containing protein [Syntrophobacteraceae bacterium]
MRADTKELLQQIYDTLIAALGPQHWWPAKTPFEVILGAMLTQNTAWKNVAAAIANLRDNNLLSINGICGISAEEFEALIRPSGYYRQKAKRIKGFCEYVLTNWNGSVEELLAQDMESLRAELLTIRGIGPETADSLVLYAALKPSFVVDTYTWRIFSRHGWVEESISYDDLREYFMGAMEPDVELFKEFHALLVRIGNLYCRKTSPLCQACPLRVFLDT